MSVTVREIGAHLNGLESIWDNGLRDGYDSYRTLAAPEVALAAALVEVATELQALGRGAPDPARLLVGDLCLARASRLLADTRDTRRQVLFARAVERVASAAAGGPEAPPLRELLRAAVAA